MINMKERVIWFGKQVVKFVVFGKTYNPKRFWAIYGLIYKTKYHTEYLKRFKKNHNDNRHISLILDTLSGLPFNTLLDVGCGYGLYLKAFEQGFPSAHIHGCDISQTQLRNARKYLGNRSRVVLTRTDGDVLPYANKSIDISFTFGVCISVPHDRIRKFIKEIMRVTKKYYLFVESDSGRDSYAYFCHAYIQLFREQGIDLKIIRELDASNNTRLYLADMMQNVG